MFHNRADAGRQLAPLLEPFRADDPVIVALPRGGVVVAAQVAEALGAPLDIVVVRKLGAPDQPELAIGAVVDSESPGVLLDERLIDRLEVPDDYVRAEVRDQIEEIRRREHVYRAGRPAIPLRDRTVIVVDDGVATGASTRAALKAIGAQRPARLVLAVPVGSPDTLAALRADADEVIALAQPDDFRAVGQFYADFDQTQDEEVITLLEAARRPHPSPAPHAHPGPEKGRSVA